MRDVITRDDDEFRDELDKARAAGEQVQSISTEGLPWRSKRVVFVEKEPGNAE